MIKQEKPALTAAGAIAGAIADAAMPHAIKKYCNGQHSIIKWHATWHDVITADDAAIFARKSLKPQLDNMLLMASLPDLDINEKPSTKMISAHNTELRAALVKVRAARVAWINFEAKNHADEKTRTALTEWQKDYAAPELPSILGVLNINEKISRIPQLSAVKQPLMTAQRLMSETMVGLLAHEAQFFPAPYGKQLAERAAAWRERQSWLQPQFGLPEWTNSFDSVIKNNEALEEYLLKAGKAANKPFAGLDDFDLSSHNSELKNIKEFRGVEWAELLTNQSFLFHMFTNELDGIGAALPVASTYKGELTKAANAWRDRGDEILLFLNAQKAKQDQDKAIAERFVPELVA